MPNHHKKTVGTQDWDLLELHVCISNPGSYWYSYEGNQPRPSELTQTQSP